MSLLQMRDVSLRNRRRYYLIANSTIGGWLLTGIMVALLRVADFDLSWWLSVHTFTIGVVTSAIVIYSYHFAEALTRTASQSYRGRLWRLGLLQFFLIGLISSNTGIAWTTVTTISALGIIGVLLAQVVVLVRKLRGSLAGTFVHTINYYLLAALHLVVAIVIVIVANHEIGNYGQLIIIHSRLAVWGFAVLTVLGTVVTLLPTVAGNHITLVARNRMGRALVVYCGGLYLSAVALALSYPQVAAIGTAIIAVAIILIVQPILVTALAGHTALPKPPLLKTTLSPAALGIISGLLWLIGLLGLDTYSFAINHDGRDLMLVIVVPLIFGGFVQLITSVLSYLLPVVIGGGTAVAATQSAIMRTGFIRLILLNLGGMLALLDQDFYGLLLVLPTTTWTIGVLGSCLYKQRKMVVQ